MVSTNVASQRQRFRDLIMAPEILVLPGAWDGMSALLIEQAGFQGVYITGGGIARSSGVPDIGLVTMSEQIARVRMICEVVSVPVLADADATTHRFSLGLGAHSDAEVASLLTQAGVAL